MFENGTARSRFFASVGRREGVPSKEGAFWRRENIDIVPFSNILMYSYEVLLIKECLRLPDMWITSESAEQLEDKAE
jgi:hypothetical protein